MASPNLESARSALNERLELLTHRHKALEKHLRNDDGRLEADFSDRVAFTEMDEVLEQLDASSLMEVEAIRNALRRVDLGTYGTCLSCGAKIEPKRLELLPATPFCTTCAEARAN